MIRRLKKWHYVPYFDSKDGSVTLYWKAYVNAPERLQGTFRSLTAAYRQANRWQQSQVLVP